MLKGVLLHKAQLMSELFLEMSDWILSMKIFPGQWGGIILLAGSHGNYMDFSIIRNAEYGIRLGSPDIDTIPDIVLKNSN